MIETYKIRYRDSPLLIVKVCSSVTRGHSLRLQKIGRNMIYVGVFFANRIVNIWNSLPIYIVMWYLLKL